MATIDTAGVVDIGAVSLLILFKFSQDCALACTLLCNSVPKKQFSIPGAARAVHLFSESVGNSPRLEEGASIVRHNSVRSTTKTMKIECLEYTFPPRAECVRVVA
jgi:hypothetical protein